MAENLQLAKELQMIKQTTESKRQAKHSSTLVMMVHNNIKLQLQHLGYKYESTY